MKKKYENSSGQSQILLTFNHFWRSPWDTFLPSYIDFRPVVFEISCGQGLKCSRKGGGSPNFFTLRLCNKIVINIRETRVKRETCHIFYIAYRKLLAVTNYYKVYNVFIT